jgi:hypothetical protein
VEDGVRDFDATLLLDFRGMERREESTGDVGRALFDRTEPCDGALHHVMSLWLRVIGGRRLTPENVSEARLVLRSLM